MYKHAIKIVVLFVMLSGYVCEVSGQVLGQDNAFLDNIKQQTAPYDIDKTFDRVEEFFFKEKYSLVLIEIDKLEGITLNSYQQSILPFYKSIAEAFMINGSAVSTISDFLELNKDYIYANLALALLAEENFKDDKVAEAGLLFKKVEVGALSSSMKIRYNYYYGKYFLENDQYQEARYRFTQASLRKSIYHDDAIYYLSYIKYVEGDYAEALDGFISLAAKTKYSKSGIYVAQINFVNGDFQYIVDNAEKLKELAKGKDELEFYRILGESHFNLDNYSDAISALEKYKELGGVYNREHNYIVGYSYYMNNAYPIAILYFTKIIDGESSMTQNAYYHLADSYLKVNDRKGALRAFSMAAAMDNSNDISEDALYNQVKLTYEMGAGDVYSQLIELMQRYLTKFPKSTHANEINGYLLSVYINTSDYKNAIKAIEKVSNPSNSVLSALQRMCYEQALESIDRGSYSEALEMLDKTIKYDMSAKYSALAIFWKAECQLKLGDLDSSIAQFKKFISLSTPQVREHFFAYYNIAYIYFNNKNWNNAKTWFDDFVNKYNKNDIYKADAMNRIGDIYFNQSNYAMAVNHYLQAVDVNYSGSDYSQFQTAISYGLMNKSDSKIEQLNKLVNSSETVYRDMAIVELATTYNQNNKYKLSESLLNDFVKTQQQSPYYIAGLLEMAVANANQNKNDEAIKYYKQIIVQFPNSVETKSALLALKSIYVSEGEASKYIAFVDKENVQVIDGSQKEAISFESIQHQYLTNEIKKVVSLGKDYEREYPSGIHRLDVAYYMGESYMKMQDSKNALSEFEKIINMPNNQYTVSSLGYVNNIYMQNGNDVGRYNINEKLYSFAKDEVIRQKALETIMALSLEIGIEDNIRKAYKKVLSDSKATKNSVELAHFAKGRLAFAENDYVTAFAELRKSGMSVSKKEGAESEYMKAVILFSESKFEDTEAMILAFASKGTPHQYWLAKSFILLGDVYTKRDDLFQAKATYQSILEGYTVSDDGVISEAQKKIDEIEMMAAEQAEAQQAEIQSL